MPAPQEYLKGYNLQKGMVLAGHQLESIDLKHETVSTYREYRYPIVMVWKNISGSSSKQDLISALDQHVAADRVIYTRYGNPYKCHFGNLDHHYQDNDSLVVNAIGYCHRV